MNEKFMRLFNLLVSHLPGLREARRALRIVKSIVHGVRVIDTPQSLLVLKVDDPYKAVKLLSRSIDPHDTPILRIIPVDVNTRPFITYVREAVEHLSSKIPSGASFAIRIEGRLYDENGVALHKMDAVRVLAEPIDRPVNLKNPDYIVLVKTVTMSYGQRYAAVTVTEPSNIVSLAKMRRVEG